MKEHERAAARKRNGRWRRIARREAEGDLLVVAAEDGIVMGVVLTTYRSRQEHHQLCCRRSKQRDDRGGTTRYGGKIDRIMTENKRNRRRRERKEISWQNWSTDESPVLPCIQPCTPACIHSFNIIQSCQQSEPPGRFPSLHIPSHKVSPLSRSPTFNLTPKHTSGRSSLSDILVYPSYPPGRVGLCGRQDQTRPDQSSHHDMTPI